MADETSANSDAPASAAEAAIQPTLQPNVLLAPGSAADGSQEGEPADWQPPQVNNQGFAVDGNGAPINLRMRSIHFADLGEKEDPDNFVSPEAISQAADQLAAYDKAYPSLSSMKKADLVKQAEAEGVTYPEGATADEISSAITAARPARIA
jgi:hypothetical protein